MASHVSKGMASWVAPDEGESAKNTTFSDHSQVEYLILMLVTLRAR